MSSRAVAVPAPAEPSQRGNGPKDNWLGFVGDVLKFTGEVQFRSMLRIDGHFAGHVDSDEGTLIVSNGAQVSHAVINVAVAKINGTVEGDINATKELVLGPTANVTGNISARLLTVQEGALLNGGCVLLPSTETEKLSALQSKHRTEKK